MAVKNKGLLIDITKCIGCEACSTNCKVVNCLPENLGEKLDENNWTVVSERPKGVFTRDLCRHCEKPACVSVCPVAALVKNESNSVTYDKSICLGCRYCMVGCAFKIPKYEWHSNTPRVRKCILCEPRIKEGKSTGCAEACPTEATVFGDRDTLIKLAEARIAAAPKKYHNHIYGLDEVGGTSVLFITSVPFEKIGFNMGLGAQPLPEKTWRVVKHTFNVFGGVGAFLGASYFIFKRRAKVQAAAEKQATENKKKEVKDE